MKAALRFSLILNLLLALIVAWFAGRRSPGEDRVGTEAQAPLAQKPYHEAQGQSGASPTDFAWQGFRWESLESSDYPTYISNLRAIGCPEQTIRDIITADVKSLYARKREELTRLLAAADSNHADPLRTELDELAADENSTLVALLGPDLITSPNSSPARSPASLPAWKLAQQQRAPAVLPLALQAADLDLGSPALNLDRQQIDAVKELGGQFRERMLSSGLAPSDPAYRELWKKAQAETDGLMFAHLGFEKYVNYELALRRAQH